MTTTSSTLSVSPRLLPLKVSTKGAVSVYGLGRFPVTLYESQMTALLANAEAIKAFMAANADNLARKGD